MAGFAQPVKVRDVLGPIAACALLLAWAAPGRAQPRAAFSASEDAAQEREFRDQREQQPARRRATSPQSRQPAARKRNPGIPPGLIEHLLQLPAGKRRQFLRDSEGFQQLPPAQQRRVYQRLQRLSQLPKEEQQLLLERYRLFRDLAPERQTLARRIYQRWREIEPKRRQELLEEVESLRAAPPDARRERFESKKFTEQYSTEEQRILRALVRIQQSQQ